MKKTLANGEEVLRIHGVAVMGNGKMHMVPQCGFQQSCGAYSADGLAQFHSLAHRYRHFRR